MDSCPRRQLNLDLDDSELLDVDTEPSTIPDSYPENWKQWDHWMVSQVGSKKPIAATADHGENPKSWSDPENWTDFETAQSYAKMDPRREYVIFILDRDDDKPYTDDPDTAAYIDFDDAVVDGRIHPWVHGVVQMARSYACLSTGGDGVHIEVLGELPDDVTAISTEEPVPEHPDFPDTTIEIYDGKRVDVLSGERIAGTPPTATRQDDLLEALCDFFVDEDDRTANAGSYDNHEFSYPAEEIEKMEIGDIDAVSDAVAYVTPDDISLKSTKTEEKGNRHSWDPCWGYNSDSGTTLGYDESQGLWIWRDGDKKINALDVVALEERLVTTPGETLTGKDYIEALDELRRRGASIPKLEPPERKDEFADVNEDAFERDTTASMTVFSAAMKAVDPEDISLRESMTLEFKRAGDRHWLHEPSGELVDTLQLVAYSEGLTDSVSGRVAGRVDWIKLGHALRWRGADVPRYEP